MLLTRRRIVQAACLGGGLGLVGCKEARAEDRLSDDEKRSLEVAQTIVDALNEGNARRYESLLHNDLVAVSSLMSKPIRGPRAKVEFMKNCRQAIRDLRFDIQQTLVSGPFVFERWEGTGIHTGELAGIAPSNRQVKFEGLSLSEYRDGKQYRAWVRYDTRHLLR